MINLAWFLINLKLYYITWIILQHNSAIKIKSRTVVYSSCIRMQLDDKLPFWIQKNSELWTPFWRSRLTVPNIFILHLNLFVSIKFEKQLDIYISLLLHFKKKGKKRSRHIGLRRINIGIFIMRFMLQMPSFYYTNICLLRISMVLWYYKTHPRFSVTTTTQLKNDCQDKIGGKKNCNERFF